MLTPPSNPGGKAVLPVRTRNYAPGEFSAALKEMAGLTRSTAWVERKCRAKEIKTLPAFSGRHVIPESELFRLAGLEDRA